MAGVIKKDDRRPLTRASSPAASFNDEIKAYRELQRTLTESDALSTKDTLNLDGPKFTFAITGMIRPVRARVEGGWYGRSTDAKHHVAIRRSRQNQRREPAPRVECSPIASDTRGARAFAAARTARLSEAPHRGRMRNRTGERRLFVKIG